MDKLLAAASLDPKLLLIGVVGYWVPQIPVDYHHVP